MCIRDNYYPIQWSVDSLDWKNYGVDSIITTVCNHKALAPDVYKRQTHRIPVTPAIPETRKIPIIPATPVSSMDLVDQIINDKLHKMRYNRLSEHNSGNLFCILKQH